MDDLTGELLAGLPEPTARLLARAPVAEPRLLELDVRWTGLSPGPAAMAEFLRVFVITWDPLELFVPRPDGFAATNGMTTDLELAVYFPLWRLTEIAARRGTSIAAVIGELAGSVIVTADAHKVLVSAGTYPERVVEGEAPDLLDDPEAGAALGLPQIQAAPPSWDDIGLAAITDIVQHAFGRVDLDRSPVELRVIQLPVPGCPACAGGRFGFPADLSESQERMCAPHRRDADEVINARLRRASQSNPAGWAALSEATVRLEEPHLPDGLATRLLETAEYVPDESDPADLAEANRLLALQAKLLAEAAGVFPGKPGDLTLALGADPDEGVPPWLTRLVRNLGLVFLPDEAAIAADALIRIDPARNSEIEAELAVALALADRPDDARARIEQNLARWPDDFSVRMQAGEALLVVDDVDGALAHFEAARSLAEAASNFAARARARERIRDIERLRAPAPANGPATRRRQRPGKATRSQRRRRS